MPALPILVDPQPRTTDGILDAAARTRLDALGRLVVHEGPGRMPDDVFEACLPEAVAIVGQTDVSPREPVPADHPARGVEGLLLSPHRTGGMPEAFAAIERLRSRPSDQSA